MIKKSGWKFSSRFFNGSNASLDDTVASLEVDENRV